MLMAREEPRAAPEAMEAGFPFAPMKRLALALLLPLAACGSDDAPDDADAPGSIAEAAESIEALPASGAPEAQSVSGATVVSRVSEASDLNTLDRLLRESGVAETLAGEGPFTLFAPSDAAFQGMDIEALLADPGALRAVLTGHALPFRTLSDGMDFEQTVETMGGTNLDIVPGTPPSVAQRPARA